MNNQPKMSKRAAEALEILANGGRFIRQLERNGYTGREQFQYRCTFKAAPYGDFARGIGFAAFCELQRLDLIQFDPDNTGSGRQTMYKLRAA
jgi:hypothetical protein